MVYTFALLVSIIVEHDSRAGVKEVMVIIVVAEVDGESCEGEEGVWRFEPDELCCTERVGKVAFSASNRICEAVEELEARGTFQVEEIHV